MKPKCKFLSLFLILALLCLPILAACGTTDTTETDTTTEAEEVTSTEEITTAAEETTTSAEETTTVAANTDATPTVTEFTVTFALGEHVTVTVYETQDDMTNDENGVQATTAYARDKENGEILTDGEGQVNFLLTFDEDYELADIVIDKEAGSGYTNLKGSADTGVINAYRITKITDDLTVTITAQVIETETDADREAAFGADFVLDEHVSVIVYQTQLDLQNGTNGIENATVAYARDSSSGKLLTDGNGQINFVLVFDEDYELDAVTVTENTYKNIKIPAEDTVENSVRVTKIKADTTITITTKAKTAA